VVHGKLFRGDPFAGPSLAVIVLRMAHNSGFVVLAFLIALSSGLKLDLPCHAPDDTLKSLFHDRAVSDSQPGCLAHLDSFRLSHGRFSLRAGFDDSKSCGPNALPVGGNNQKSSTSLYGAVRFGVASLQGGLYALHVKLQV